VTLAILGTGEGEQANFHITRFHWNKVVICLHKSVDKITEVI
jgi:hypothetical protein